MSEIFPELPVVETPSNRLSIEDVEALLAAEEAADGYQPNMDR